LSFTSVKTMPRLSAVQTGWPMPTSVTVSTSRPVAISRMRRLKRSEPSSSTKTAAKRPSGLTASAPSRKYCLPCASAASSNTVCGAPPAMTGIRYHVLYCAPGWKAHQ
jgi:hypothetical protein